VRTGTAGHSAPDHAATDDFDGQHQDHYIYVGVVTRDSRHGRSLAHCRSLHSLFVDLDFKDFGSEAEARSRLAAFPLPPSIIVASGGGLQCYWRLTEPLNLQNVGSVALAKQLLTGTG
jgi:hypothetical protein